MPIYTYRCNDCGHQFEKRQRMTAEPLTECPVCNGAIRRVVGAVGVVFKGTGFYITDSRNGRGSATLSSSGKNGATGEGSEAPAGGGKESGASASTAPAADKAGAGEKPAQKA